MGKPVGLPEWLAITLVVALALGVWMTFGFFALRRARRKLAAKRPSPTRAEFLTMMQSDVDKDVAQWMWDQCKFYYRPLTPHPDDHLLYDARIDDDDVGLDWLPEFAKARGLDCNEWPDWPEDCPLPVRNFARWLQSGLREPWLEPAPEPCRDAGGGDMRPGDQQPERDGR